VLWVSAFQCYFIVADTEENKQMNEAKTTATKVDTESHKELENLKADLKKLQADMAELAGSVKTAASEKAATAKDQVNDEAQHALKELQNRLNDLMGQGRETLDQAGEQIGQHPVSSLVGAFGLGFILAMLLERGGNSGSSG